MFRKVAAVLLVLAILPAGSFACTAIYIGSGLTADGSTIFARLEEYTSDEGWPKLFDVIPEGAHTAGEVYTGCYGFTWTFTHDSYGYTAFRDNNSPGICPDCGGTHAHTPYQAGGTNSRGVSVTATETLVGKEAVTAIDPYNKESGIEEAEIPTILLSEASSAREAMLLLASIYTTTGAYGAGSVIVADSDEAWYIENHGGSQYLAVRMNADLVFVCPNISVIGLTDLNDPENVAASDALIETAVRAGTFTGDAEAGRIDYAASYDDAPASVYPRLAAGLNAMSGEHTDPADLMPSGMQESIFRISNVDSEGKTVLPYTNIRLKGKTGIRDVMALYQHEPVSRHRSLETHIFQISGPTAHGTVEWVSMADNRTSVFVPWYPMVTTEVPGYFHAGTAMPQHMAERPAEGLYYETENGGWGLYPDGWRDSWYWVFSMLEHIARDDEAAAVYIRERMDVLQDDICASGVTGNPAAEICWRTALDLLSEFGR
ncbi:MAG: C69 family dipeptidase [Clostridia bacterium]|nr:C69 family dipeptidase [Clostridia bacterium]